MSIPAKTGIKQVKPILSLTHGEARRRIINLYRAWYRNIPYIRSCYNLPKSEEDCRKKLREEFKRHSNLTDVRTIDVLYIKGKEELQNSLNYWKPCSTFLNYWKESYEEKPKDFMSKFLSGHN